MRAVVILDEGAADIEAGRDFYDRQQLGIGNYFEDSLLSDIESLVLFQEYTPSISDFIVCLPQDFLLEFIMMRPLLKPKWLLSWI